MTFKAPDPYSPDFIDRRSPTPWNRIRRFFNNYWLIPIVVIYLQFLAALMSANGETRDGLLERNRTFFSGVPWLISIVTTDFPDALVGHGKEMAFFLAQRLGPVSAEGVVQGVAQQKRDIFLALWESRNALDTEVGGVMVMDPELGAHLHPIPSSNGALVRSLDGLTPEQGMRRLRAEENRSVIRVLAGNSTIVERVARVIENPLMPDDVKARAYSSIRYSLEVASESRYFVHPIEFKAALGRLPGPLFAGVYHFHNELGVPPSEADLSASFGMRQFVFALARDGFVLYDIVDGRVAQTHFSVQPEAYRLNPELAPPASPTKPL